MKVRRIIYGVSGEGSGHSSRALEIGRHLVAQGHVVKMVSYDRGYRNLAESFDVLEIEGLHIVSEQNRVRPLKTVWHNLRRARRGWQRLQALRQLFREFKPDYVLTDFEPTTAWLAKLSGIPLISVDNQHRMRYMKYQAPISLWWSRMVAVMVIRLMIPTPLAALATTFYQGPVTNPRLHLFPPLLRREVLACEPEQGDHFLVYVTRHFGRLVEVLGAFPEQRFVVYGSAPIDLPNVECRPFSRDGFLDDLRTCRAVVATAGFTLISEAIYLGKPYFAMPLAGQFEQQLNALFLEDMGIGRRITRVNRDTFQRFLLDLPALTDAAQHHASQGRASASHANMQLNAKLDELMAQPVQN